VEQLLCTSCGAGFSEIPQLCLVYVLFFSRIIGIPKAGRATHHKSALLNMKNTIQIEAPPTYPNIKKSAMTIIK
jgi:hypothetical protein